MHYLRVSAFVCSSSTHQHVIYSFCSSSFSVPPCAATTTDGSVPLHSATYRGHAAVVQKLIAAGANVNEATKKDSTTPLYRAARQGHSSIVGEFSVFSLRLLACLQFSVWLSFHPLSLSLQRYTRYADRSGSGPRYGENGTVRSEGHHRTFRCVRARSDYVC